FMTQIVGGVLTATDNNYAVLFTMIPAMYFIALTWLYFMAPRRAPPCLENKNEGTLPCRTRATSARSALPSAWARACQSMPGT
ncbi:hypothetical protein KGZ13_33990, partial [Pseudomonas aeruginosa]|nr:hypothetical protein [Pseudomonas aeruginosa]